MNDTQLSFEFFPPKTEEGQKKLAKTHEALSHLKPDFFSVTYGAGGSTRDNTRNVVVNLQNTGSSASPHLSFGGDNEDAVLQLLHDYKEHNISRVVALRGDLPSGMGRTAQLVYANQLVEFIRKHFDDYFKIYVAAYPEIHPEAESYKKDIYWLGEKFRAGANQALTQYFYNPDAYFYFVDDCQKAGINQPIIPGVMPIVNFQSLLRFSDNCGADIPRWIKQKLSQYQDDPESMTALGIEIVSKLCETLLAGGAPGLHFYTMNQAATCEAICNNIYSDR